MRPKSSIPKRPAEQVVKDIRRATRRHFSAEDKIRIVLEGLRGEDSIAELCRKEGMAPSPRARVLPMLPEQRRGLPGGRYQRRL